MKTELTEKQEDSYKRIIGMSVTDIMDMPYECMIELIDNFESELLIREVVSRGYDKGWQKSISNRLKGVFDRWYDIMDWYDRRALIQEGRIGEIEEWLKSIIYDIHSNILIKPYIAPPSFPIPLLGESKPIRTSDSGEDDINQLKERNKKLASKNKQLKKTNKSLERQLKVLQRERLEVKLEKEDENSLYNKVSFEFFLRLLESAGFDINNPGNKTRAGQLWHMMTGKSADDLRKFCSDRVQYNNNHTKDDIKRLNKHLGDMGISTIEL